MLLGIPVFEGVNLLDVTGPLEMFYWAKTLGKKDLETVLVSQDGKGVTSTNGVFFQAQASFADVPALDVLWVPGAGEAVIGAMMQNPHCAYLNYLRQVSAGAAWVCSVCEGALLLARAGLLHGHKATTHWSVARCLDRFPGVEVDFANPRFVVSRNRFGNRLTGGGVSSGLDEALKLICLLFDEAAAETAQVVTQYFPDPPVRGKIPASPECGMHWT